MYVIEFKKGRGRDKKRRKRRSKNGMSRKKKVAIGVGLTGLGVAGTAYGFKKRKDFRLANDLMSTQKKTRQLHKSKLISARSKGSLALKNMNTYEQHVKEGLISESQGRQKLTANMANLKSKYLNDKYDATQYRILHQEISNKVRKLRSPNPFV